MAGAAEELAEDPAAPRRLTRNTGAALEAGRRIELLICPRLEVGHYAMCQNIVMMPANMRRQHPSVTFQRFIHRWVDPPSYLYFMFFLFEVTPTPQACLEFQKEAAERRYERVLAVPPFLASLVDALYRARGDEASPSTLL